MDSTRPILVVDYIDCPFDEVCALLADWQNRWLRSPRDRRPIARTGRLDRIADHVVRVTMFDDCGDAIAELRVLAVSTGHEVLTEVVVFVHPSDQNEGGRAMALRRARTILDSAVRGFEATGRHAAPSRAS